MNSPELDALFTNPVYEEIAYLQNTIRPALKTRKGREFIDSYCGFLTATQIERQGWEEYSLLTRQFYDLLDDMILKINLDAWKKGWRTSAFHLSTGLRWSCGVADGSADYVWVEGYIIHLNTYDGYHAPAPTMRGLILEDFLTASLSTRQWAVRKAEKAGEPVPTFEALSMDVADLIEVKE